MEAVLGIIFVLWLIHIAKMALGIPTPTIVTKKTGVQTLHSFRTMKQEYMEGPEWDKKRRATLFRDDYTCQRCGANGVSLDVHHERGYKDIPYETIDCLKSLCRKCHGKEHEENGFPKTLEDYMSWDKPIKKES